MKQIFSIIGIMAAVMSLTSCGISYNIEGSSDISGLDNRMMYLITRMGSEEKAIDSVEVVHGKFGFSGSTDSVRIAFIVVGEGSLPLPLVLEKGGTPLNDRLYRFMKSLDSLTVKLQDLDHEYTLAFMDGEDMNEVIPRLSRANQLINLQIDTLVTSSICDNFDNILGPGIFMLMTRSQQPSMEPWVVEIMSKATDNFKNDPYVREYLNAAHYIQNVQNGLESAPTSAAPAAPSEAAAEPTPPTPNELAAPTDSSAKGATP